MGTAPAVQGGPECGANSPDDHWDTVRIFDYQPVQTLYMVEWQHCAGDIQARRVRVTDSDFQKVFYEFADDEVLRVERVELLDDQVPQVLIVTGSSGTNDRVDWHVISEVNGQLHEWAWPAYNAPAKKLLGADESFCCKEWNFHLRGHDIFLARGIYDENEDGNCCPSRGGVLVLLKPSRGRFNLVRVQRISRPEYYRWRSQPFCSQCTLAGP